MPQDPSSAGPPRHPGATLALRSIPVSAVGAAQVREQLRAWLWRCGISAVQINDVVAAGYEAVVSFLDPTCGSGRIDLQVRVDGGGVWLSASGPAREPGVNASDDARWDLRLMCCLAPKSWTAHLSTGVVITLHWPEPDFIAAATG
ncbi:hypothetical protein FOS14_09800 [Skermania sp. ID1734]|uniref:hypothetical protein n=1 Tax=Skermania sp. ID1734 TaxID=2597516 RepID=UPI00117F3B82|nr:hypothetical protein [Skermania sp. ID1734]TSE00096.1 hypothetical protein FOS14_09800 [Skermania sp. ID1734]